MNVEKDDIIGALKTVYDPEIPVNIWDLGLIYNIDIKGTRDVIIQMTFTSPTCPTMEELLEMVRVAVRALSKDINVSIDLVWTPAWDISRMSRVARAELDLVEQGW